MAAIRRATGTDTQNSESLLQHAYFIAVVAIIFALVVFRILILRRRNRALTDFFRVRSQYAYGSHPPSDTLHGPMYPGTQLAPLPAVYRRDRRVHGADIDLYGRRLGPGEGPGKDALPAYDGFDRPPKYIEAGWSHGTPLEQSAVIPSPEGEQSIAAPPNTTTGAAEENSNRFDDTHGAAGVSHRTGIALPPPTHHDLSSS